MIYGLFKIILSKLVKIAYISTVDLCYLVTDSCCLVTWLLPW